MNWLSFEFLSLRFLFTDNGHPVSLNIGLKPFPPTGSMCSLRNDPHITGFYGWAYDFHGILEYYIAMNIDTYGVTGDFYQCNTLASCLDIITYKDGVDTIITFDKDDGNTVRKEKRRNELREWVLWEGKVREGRI